MTANDSLKNIEKRAYRSTFSDGLYDLAFGTIFMLMALIPVLESVGISRFFGYPFFIIPALIVVIGKRVITVPRMGSVEFGPKRKRKSRIILLIAAIAMFFMLPLLIIMFSTGLPDRLMWTTVVLIGAPLILLSVILLDHPRFILYCVFLFFGILLTEFMLEYIGVPIGHIVAFGFPGILINIYGLTLLATFVKKYPKLSSEANHVAG